MQQIVFCIIFKNLPNIKIWNFVFYKYIKYTKNTNIKDMKF